MRGYLTRQERVWSSGIGLAGAVIAFLRKERCVHLGRDGFSPLPVLRLPAISSPGGLSEAGERRGMETEQLPQQQLKMHHQKGFWCKGARSWPCSPDGPAAPLSPVPSPVQPPRALGGILGGAGCWDFLLHLGKRTKQGVWRAWQPVWVWGKVLSELH